jgi:cell shape-determining protein MreC
MPALSLCDFQSARLEFAAVAMVRTNYLFYAMMALAFVAAFVLPHATLPGSGHLLGIFQPVARPARALAAWMDRKIHAPVVVDDVSPVTPRSPANVYEENHQLATALASLQMKFEQLSQLNADRQAVGDIRGLCKPATVIGADSSPLRETLTITVGGSTSAIVNRPVIRGNLSQSPLPCDLIGRVVRAGLTGAQVRLVTDPGASLTARIGHYDRDEQGKVKMTLVDQLHLLVTGAGGNEMAIRLSMQQAQEAKIAVGDLVVLDDRDWPANIQGFAVGHVKKIRPQPNAPLFADIRVEPAGNLLRLTEVMVMVKD